MACLMCTQLTSAAINFSFRRVHPHPTLTSLFLWLLVVSKMVPVLMRPCRDTHFVRSYSVLLKTRGAPVMFPSWYKHQLPLIFFSQRSSHFSFPLKRWKHPKKKSCNPNFFAPLLFGVKCTNLKCQPVYSVTLGWLRKQKQGQSQTESNHSGH